MSLNDPLRRHRLLIIVLAAMTVFDCLGIDMYLPAFGAMEQEFALDAGGVGMTLSIFMLGLGLGQAIFGPMSDRIGRKPPLLIGMALLIAASVVIALTDNFPILMAARFMQGLGGAAGLVIPRAVTGDLFEEKDSVAAYTFLMLVQCVTPVLAPAIGYVLLELSGWRSMFWFVAVLALAAALLAARIIPETNPRQKREAVAAAGNAADTLKAVFCNPRYLWMTAASCSSYGALFAYLTAAHHICVDLFETSLEHFTTYFVVNSAGLVAVGWLSLQMAKRLPLSINLRFGFLGHLVCAGLLLAAAAFNTSLLVVEAALFLYVSSLSLIFGALTTEVMFSVRKEDTGSASAVVGTLQYVTAATAGAIVNLLPEKSALAVFSLFSAFSLAALVCWIAGRNCLNRRNNGESLL